MKNSFVVIDDIENAYWVIKFSKKLPFVDVKIIDYDSDSFIQSNKAKNHFESNPAILSFKNTRSENKNKVMEIKENPEFYLNKIQF